ncbi:MAG: autotransporter outer membrane beta-barrel domain-containing protein [Gammaproteobacteria bacterium]|nr:autotransporter outer membrane beta-barrel domain-containing protein [Gammaproteobacteria bacterium]
MPIIRKIELQRQKCRGIVLSVFLYFFIHSTASFADLTQISGMNEAQASAGAMIQDICPRMGAIQADLTTSQNALFEKCRALVQTSNEQQESGGSTFSLGYNEAELRDALQDIAHEEVGVNGTVATDTLDNQFSNVASRLNALQSGVRQSGMGGFAFNLGDQQLSGQALYKALSNATGGMAGDGDQQRHGWGYYLNGSFNFGEKDASAREDGFDFDTVGITVGSDYQLSDTVVLGGALGYSQTDANIINNGGDAESDGYSLSFYGTHFIKNGLYFDAIVSYGNTTYDTSRTISFANNVVNDTLSGNTDGSHTSVNLGMGQNFEPSNTRWAFSTYGRLAYTHIEIDSYAESSAIGSALELAIGEQSIKSMASTLGAQVSHAISTRFAIFVPHLQIEYHHEFKDDSRNLSARYVNDPFGNTFFNVATDEADKNYFTIGGGFSTVFHNGTQLFAYYETTAGLRDIENNLIVLGLRGEI